MALEYFNRARSVNTWRKEACTNMIEIYLKLDNYDYWSTTTTTTIKKQQNKSKMKKIPPTKSIIGSIEILLKELSHCSCGSDCHRKVELFKGYLNLMSSFTNNGVFDSTAIDTCPFHSILSLEKVWIVFSSFLNVYLYI